jgi:hypothetical protein
MSTTKACPAPARSSRKPTRKTLSLLDYYDPVPFGGEKRIYQRQSILERPGIRSDSVTGTRDKHFRSSNRFETVG